MSFKDLPKVELHLHLDCSLSFQVVKQLKPTITLAEYQQSFIAPKKCNNLADYLKHAVKGFELMQTPEQLRLVTFDLFRQLNEDKVVYAEIRFAPLLHTFGGLSPEQVVKVVNDAVGESTKKHGIHAGIILCTLRRHSEAQSMQTVELVQKYEGTHVVGFDIAGNEAGFPITDHVKAFQFANRNNLPCTAHAGEAKGAASVWETLENFRPARIGHGVRSTEADELVSFLKEKEIHLEICPTSNIQVDVFDKIEDHPINTFFDSGLSLSINTDGRAVSNVSLTDEYNLLHQVFGWDKSHFKKCNLEAIKHSFASPEIKDLVRARIERSYWN
ncbi:adenosine deaminase [Neolewinella aurantiaca]|uniref:Adenosine deaminase n=1 Tax=Neolewinella aurantiaca TaxID=2602767 RepID=A0A5C7F8M0_9BACT|nr:adenosine deaminase [Neolewinella aurantiaca]TXF80970.1 adenosine deaminase [Neolewinella aurantiaca]